MTANRSVASQCGWALRSLGSPWVAQRVRLVVAEQLDHRQQNDLDVEHRRPVPQVIEIVIDARLHLLELRGLAAAAVHLRKSGDAGQHLVANHVALDELAVLLVVRDRVRPRTHETHAALKHVDELRQLIERGAAQEGADRRDALVRFRGLPNACRPRSLSWCGICRPRFRARRVRSGAA
jgi:hypothetical protein